MPAAAVQTGFSVRLSSAWRGRPFAELPAARFLACCRLHSKPHHRRTVFQGLFFEALFRAQNGGFLCTGCRIVCFRAQIEGFLFTAFRRARRCSAMCVCSEKPGKTGTYLIIYRICSGNRPFFGTKCCASALYPAANINLKLFDGI